MARGRQRRKERRRAINADEHLVLHDRGGVATELVEEADAPVRGPEGEDAGAIGLEGVAGVAGVGDASVAYHYDEFNHALLPGIRMFTAMLAEVRAGFVIDRLAELEAALEVEFTPLEREGIVEVANAQMYSDGVPAVDYAVEFAMQARAALDVALSSQPGSDDAPVAEDDVPLEPPAPVEEDEIEPGEDDDPDAPGADEVWPADEDDPPDPL